MIRESELIEAVKTACESILSDLQKAAARVERGECNDDSPLEFWCAAFSQALGGLGGVHSLIWALNLSGEKQTEVSEVWEPYWARLSQIKDEFWAKRHRIVDS